MTEPFKLPTEEHEVLVNLQIRWNELTKRYGELHYQRKGVDAELILTDAALDELDNERFEMVNKLQEKYGVGQVNLATGTFIPDVYEMQSQEGSSEVENT